MAIDPAFAIGYAVMVAASFALWVLLFGGLARIPWLHALQIAVGVTVVLTASSLASRESGRPIDPGILVLLAAVGGGVAVRAYERGRARRDAMIQEILRPH
jgi:hypothetical protein